MYRDGSTSVESLTLSPHRVDLAKAKRMPAPDPGWRYPAAGSKGRSVQNLTNIPPINPPADIKGDERTRHTGCISFLYRALAQISGMVFENRGAFGSWVASEGRRLLGRNSFKYRGAYRGKQ